ncbi:flagellar export chaperone FliS [Salinispira pacifica]|nr:flagellar export chaperone FliS [Salinispira pacifica]
MPMTNYQTNAYKETRVKTAGQGQIIVMLYDEAIKQIGYAVKLLDENSKELDKVNNAIMKARDIITELMVSLDMEQGGEFATRMFAVYQWFSEQLIQANLKKETQPLRQVKDMMSEIREAWNQIAGKTNVEGSDGRSGVNIAG